MFKHLVSLVSEYYETRKFMETGALDIQDLLIKNSELQVLHEQIIEELARLGYPVATREEALERARAINLYFREYDEDEYE